MCVSWKERERDVCAESILCVFSSSAIWRKKKVIDSFFFFECSCVRSSVVFLEDRGQRWRGNPNSAFWRIINGRADRQETIRQVSGRRVNHYVTNLVLHPKRHMPSRRVHESVLIVPSIVITWITATCWHNHQTRVTFFALFFSTIRDFNWKEWWF